VPKGFGADVLAGRDVTVSVVKDPRTTASLAIVEAIRGAARRVAGNAIAVQNVASMYGAGGPRGATRAGDPGRRDVYTYARTRYAPDPPVSVRAVNVQQTKTRSDAEMATGFSQYSLGFTVAFMVFIAFGGAGGFLEEREIGTLSRLLSTPASKATLVGGKVAGIFITTMAQAGLLIIAGATIFGVPWGNDPLAVTAILVAFGLAATGMGVMLSTIVTTRSQLSGLTPVVAIGMAMLGGCYWPIDVVPPFMRQIGMLTPDYWAMQGLTSVVVRSQGLSAAILPIAVLIVFAALSFAVGLVRLKLE
jgi:ABC-2 type transport system permease protein